MSGAVMVREVLLLLVMFWNLENFFDPVPGNSGIVQRDSCAEASLLEGEPYTPRGEKFWTWKKFGQKRDDIARTVALVKEEYNLFPALIGLAEVENRQVLYQLLQNTILAPLDYHFIHKDSPDRRGIDVALLYRKSEFRPLATEFIPLRESATNSIVPTREMLYAKGLFRGMDTLHLFVVHWPSKLGGKEAITCREEAARLLAEKSDSIMGSNSKANIIVMGDFNDDLKDNATLCAGGLVNVAPVQSKVGGTYKYKGKWDRIDHFLVNGQMIGNEELKYLYCEKEGSDIFAHPFLLEEDKVYLGYKVRRTLVGPRYNGGVSDHLPILLRVYGYCMQF